MKISALGERLLIERFRKQIRLDKSVIIGSGDDAAVIKWKKDKLLLFTCDMLIENVHFVVRKTTPYRIGHKALAVNISDIASMGGVPTQAVVSLGLPKKTRISFADGMFSGMKNLASEFGINIVGGDVNACGRIVIDIALLGEVKENELVTRSGARIGDVIMVTGALGGSGRKRRLQFRPRLKEAQFLTKNFKINSMIDISDGLSGDLGQVCLASKVGARIYESLIPVSRRAKSVKNALSDGEDFELLFTVPRKFAASVVEKFRKNISLLITPIGTIIPKSKGLELVDKFGETKPLEPGGYTHF